jgi:predicted porin
MKKSLFAIAAVTAFAGAAQAQSSVTVYGILDVGYVGGNAKANTANAAGNQTSPSETFGQFGQSAQQSSRLGFRGTEDLGGGTSAFFTFETGLSPNSSTLSAFNNRQAFVGLAQKGLGRASVGTIYTPIHSVVGRTSANQQNNLVGDVIYPQNTGITNRDGSATNANAGYTIRTNNTLQLQSDVVAGFQATAFYAMNNIDTNQTTATGSTTNVSSRSGITGGTNNSNGYGLGVNYTWKKLLATANYQSFKTEQPYTDFVNTSPSTQSGGTTVSAGSTITTTGTNTTDNQMYVAATYDFGILNAYVQYINRKVTNDLDTSNYLKRSAQQIGVRAFVTPKVETWASIGSGRYNANGEGNPTANFNGYQLGANYWLSKRTNLYGIFGGTNTSTVNYVVSGNVVGTNQNVTRTFNSNANNYGVGVRHTF